MVDNNFPFSNTYVLPDILDITLYEVDPGLYDYNAPARMSDFDAMCSPWKNFSSSNFG